MAYIKRKEVLSLPRTFPSLPLYEQHKDFIRSKNATNELSPPYDWDKPSHLPDQELVEGKCVLTTMNEKLEMKRQYFQQMRKEIDEHWKQLEIEELELRKTFIDFKNFVKENEIKRTRSSQIIEEETKHTEIVQNKIDHIQEKYDSLKAVKEKMDETIQKMLIYRNYLKEVVDANNFDSIGHLIDQYEALILARTEMVELQQKILMQFDRSRVNAIKLIEDGDAKMLNLSIELSLLSSRYQKAHQAALHWEYLIIDIKKNIIKRYSNNQLARQGLYNLYELMCARKGMEPTVDPNNYEGLCNFVKKTLQEAAQITKDVQMAAKKTPMNDFQ